MTETTSGIRITTQADDRAAREVRSLDDALEDLERTGRGLRLPDDEVDRLERELRDAGDALDGAGQAAGGLGEQLQGLAGPAAIAAAGIAAIGTALVLALRSSAEFQRQIFQTATATGEAADDIEGLARTFAVYGLEADRTSDAVRDFYERLGDARIDPASEIGEVFQLVGQDINDADANLLDFLDRVSRLEDRTQQIFAIRTILTGDSEELLTALTDANFRARLDANVELALSPQDRARLLESDAAISDASNAIGRLVDTLLSIVAPAIEAAASALADEADDLESGIDSFVRFIRDPSAFVQAEREAFNVSDLAGLLPLTPESFVPQGPTIAQAFQDQGPIQNAAEQVAQEIVEAVARAAPSLEITGQELDILPIVGNLERDISGSFERISSDAVTDLDIVRAQILEFTGDLDALSLRAGQGLRVVRDSLNLLGVEAPREFRALESAVFGSIDVLRGFTADDPFSIAAGGISLLSSAVTLLTGESDDAARSQVEYARALMEIARQADQITDAVLSGSTQLEGLRLASTEAFRAVIDAPSLDPGELRAQLESLIGAFTTDVGTTVGDLVNATDSELLRLGGSLGDLFEALGVRLEDAPTTSDFDPSELAAARREFLEPIRAFAEQLAEAFGETSGIGEVIQAALTLDGAMEDLTATIRTLTGAEEAQIRETFNLERINIRAQAQRQFQAAGADPFEQARIFQQLEGELSAITAAENAALESARAITTGALPGLGGGAPSLPPTQDQTAEIENYLTRIDELSARVQQLDLTSEAGLDQFFELAREFRGIYFEAIGTFGELPPALEFALQSTSTIFAVAGQSAALAYRDGVAGGVALLEPEVVDSQAIIVVRPSPLGDGTWDVFFVGGPDGIMLPPELGVDSERIVEIGRLQDLDQWNKLFEGGGGDQVLPDGLTADSARVFKIDGVQNIDEWLVIYAAASGDTVGAVGTEVLPAPLGAGSERVFQIGELQRLDSWNSIYAFQPGSLANVFGAAFDAMATILPAPLVVGSERVVQIGSPQILTSEDLFTFQITPRLIEAASLVRVTGSVTVPVSAEVQTTGPGGQNPAVSFSPRTPNQVSAGRPPPNSDIERYSPF